MKRKKSEKQLDKAILASIDKEMAKPRFAASAGKEENEANKRGNVKRCASLSSWVKNLRPPSTKCQNRADCSVL